MSGVLRLANTGGSNGRSTIVAAASSDATFTLPSAGGTILTTDFDTVGDITWNGSNINITNADLNVNNGLLFVDESTNQVGIGTASPAYKCDIDVTNSALRLNSTTTAATLVISSDDSAQARIEFGDETDNDRGALIYDNPDNALIFQVNTAERVRIDNKGTLLAGKNGEDLAIPGFQHRGDAIGLVQITRDGNVPLMLNRLTDNGSIIEFRKDTSGIVGSITVEDSDLGITVGTTQGLKIDPDGLITINSFTNVNAGISFRDGFTPSSFGGTGLAAFDHSGSSRDGLALYGHDGISFYTSNVNISSTELQEVARFGQDGNSLQIGNQNNTTGGALVRIGSGVNVATPRVTLSNGQSYDFTVPGTSVCGHVYLITASKSNAAVTARRIYFFASRLGNNEAFTQLQASNGISGEPGFTFAYLNNNVLRYTSSSSTDVAVTICFVGVNGF